MVGFRVVFIVVLLGWCCCLVEELEVLPKVQSNKAIYHTFEAHNYWIDRIKQCPYCNMGSIAVHRDLIVERLDKK